MREKLRRIRAYFQRIFDAILNRPIASTDEVKERVVTQPMNAGQIKHLEDLFKPPVWTEDTSMTKLAYATGQSDVVEFIKAWSSRGGKL